MPKRPAKPMIEEEFGRPEPAPSTAPPPTPPVPAADAVPGDTPKGKSRTRAKE